MTTATIERSDVSWRQRLGRLSADQRHLLLALLVAALVHALLIWALGFEIEPIDASPPLAETIEVTLVHQSTEEVPQDPDYYAQANQLGGGTTAEQVRATSPTPAPFPSPHAQLAEVVPPPSSGRQASGSPQYVTADAPVEDKATDVSIAQPSPLPDDAETLTPLRPVDQAPSAQELIRQTVEVAGLNAEYGRTFASTSRRRKHQYISANTRAYYAAAYMDAWRRKVERTGNRNYPAESRRRGIYGSLMLEVALVADGSIEDIIIVRSSGHPLLDDAAIAIVRMSAPFAPFPKAIRERTDVLHITRTWEFRRGDRVTSR